MVKFLGKKSIRLLNHQPKLGSMRLKGWKGNAYKYGFSTSIQTDDIDRGIGVEREAGQQVGNHRRIADARIALQHDVGPFEAQFVGFLPQPFRAEPAVLDDLLVPDPADDEQTETEPVEPGKLRQEIYESHRDTH